MKKHLIPFAVLSVLVIVGFTCPSSTVRLNFINEKEPGIMEALEDANCDITSEEAQDYVDCMFDVFEYWDVNYDLHTDECDDERANVPGCNFGEAATRDGLTLPTSGLMVSICPSRLPYWCPPGDSDCIETYDDYLVIDFENQTFTYEYDYDFNDPREDETQTEGTYYRGHGEGATTGIVFDGGWLLGTLNHTATSERVGDAWGVPGEPEFSEAGRTSTFLGVIEVGNPFTVRFCDFDMGEPAPTTLTDGMKQQLRAGCHFVCTLEVKE